MRSRNIKPGFFLNDDLAEVDFGTRLLFIGLWCFADREGRFERKPKKIKATIFPYDEFDIEKGLCDLMSLHVITCNDMVCQIINFVKHQHPHPHEAKSILSTVEFENNNIEQNQCHDMSLQSLPMSDNVMKCKSDVRMLGCYDSFINTSCAELENPSSLQTEIPQEVFIFEIPLADKTEFGITQLDIDNWYDVFPAIDILSELKRMRLWCEDNPKNKKTRRGVRRFCSSWLERSQNKAKPNGGYKQKISNDELIRRTLEDFNE
jgi:hypothetical protein